MSHLGVAALLREVAAVGPFFAVETDAVSGLAPPASRVERWLPFDWLADDLAARVAAARAALAARAGGAEIDRRAAASINFMGTAARLISAPFAVWVRHEVVPAVTPGTVFWRPDENGAVRFAITATEVTDDFDAMLRGVVEPLEDAVRQQYLVSRLVLRGNVASSLAGAATQLGGRAAERVRELLDRPYLRGMGSFEARYHRRNCCLFYRVPGAGTCGDCVLRARAE